MITAVDHDERGATAFEQIVGGKRGGYPADSHRGTDGGSERKAWIRAEIKAEYVRCDKAERERHTVRPGWLEITRNLIARQADRCHPPLPEQRPVPECAEQEPGDGRDQRGED